MPEPHVTSRDGAGGGSWRVGVDIGGTFTDIVAMSPSSQMLRVKVLSTSSDYSLAIAKGLAERLHPEQLAAVEAFVHGTTVATNAILQETYQPIALVTTAGFRDVIDIRRGRRPDLYDLSWTPPEPLVPRWLRFEVDERIGADGEAVTPLSEDSVQAVIDALPDELAAVAVCLLNSHANAAHEVAVADAIRAARPSLPVTTSSSIAPEPKEYERTSTTVVNAFLLPVIEDYLARLEGALADLAIPAPVQIMQSDGTNAAARLARERPFLIIESGPAAGVVAAARLAREMQRPAVVTFDMGGTTAKAGLVEDHEPRFAEELEVGDAHNRAGGLIRGAGFPVRSPCVDLSEVGAGGGSIAWIDGGGVLRVGPRSAGSDPGPACYGQGGTDATVTDAHVVLGYVSPVAIAGGSRPLLPERAHEAVARLAEQLGLSVEDTAHGIFTIATANMRRAVRAVSVERGRDPRDFSLFAFGGAGGLHAAALADELDMDEVVIPMVPGLFSSLGLLFSQLAVTRVASDRRRLSAETVADLHELAATLADDATEELRRAYPDATDIGTEGMLNLRYEGQSSSLAVPFQFDGGATDVGALLDIFHDEHRAVHGQAAPGDPVEAVALRVRAALPPATTTFHEIGRQYVESMADTATGTRRVYLGPDVAWVDAEVVSRAVLRDGARPGPLVIEEPEATTVVPPHLAASLDDTGSIVLRRTSEASRTAVRAHTRGESAPGPGGTHRTPRSRG